MTNAQRSAEVVVLGGGAAGSLAAAAAALGGHSVLLVTAAPGATTLSSGALDLASRHWVPAPESTTLAQALSNLAQTQHQHPLSRLGLARARAVAEQVNQLLGGDDSLYPQRDWSQGPWCAVTPWGGVHPAWLCQQTQLDLAQQTGRIGVVDAGPDSALPAWLASGQLEASAARWGAPASFQPVKVTLPATMDPRRPLAVAQRVEHEPGALEQLGQALRAAQQGQGLDALLLPPWGGIEGAPAILQRLSEAAGLALYETLGRPGDPCGLRLSRRLEGVARRCGATVVQGRALSLLSQGERVTGVLLQGQEQPLAVAACVLACGGLAGGGLEFDGTLAPSLVPALPLALGGQPWRQSTRRGGADPTPLLGARLAAPHPLFAAGVPVDDQLRPLGSEGPRWSNVHAAGALLADHDPVADGSGLSTALITGFCAGRWASGQQLSP